MLFVVVKKDKPGQEQVRAEARPAHMAFLAEHAEKVVFAGPLTSEDGASSIGSLLAVEAASVAEAKAFLDADPFAIAGIFESVEILPWRWVINPPAG